MSFFFKVYIVKIYCYFLIKYYFCDEGNVSLFIYCFEYMLYNILFFCDF